MTTPTRCNTNDDTYRAAIGARLQAARRNLSALSLSRLSGVHRSAIAGMEAGKKKRVDLHSLVMLANALGVSVEWLTAEPTKRGAPVRAAGGPSAEELETRVRARLKQRRLDLGFGMPPCAQAAGVYQSAWVRLENGEDLVDVIRLRRCARVLETSVPFLLTGDDGPR